MTTSSVELLAVADESVSWFEDDWDSGKNPDMWIYRQRTVALLNRYFQMSMEMGKLPSILGQQFFRGHVTSYSVSSFEDVVIFIHDVETQHRETRPAIAAADRAPDLSGIWARRDGGASGLLPEDSVAATAGCNRQIERNFSRGGHFEAASDSRKNQKRDLSRAKK